jgi:hypothetical protein
LVLVILLAGCQPEEQYSAATQIPLRVELSQTLEYLSPAISACAMQNPELQLILEEKPAGDMGKTGADVSLIWGDHTIPAGSRIFRLGADRLVFAAHKTNPLQQLTVSQVFQLDRGGFSTWADALKQFCPACTAADTFTAASVDIWHYSPGTEVYAEIASLSLDSPAAPNGRILLAPSARTLSEIITNNPAAVGWLPARWLNENLKEITLAEIEPSRQVIPVIAATPGEPSKLAARWLQCLQSSYGN